jgi:hypothetical protein
MIAIHSHVERSGFSSPLPEWLYALVWLIGVAGALLCVGFLVPAIFGFFRWVGAMRARRRLGRVMVVPVATLKREMAAEKNGNTPK